MLTNVYPIQYPDPTPFALTFDIGCLKELNSAYSGPLMNAQFSRVTFKHFKISINFVVISHGIKIFHTNALKLLLQYSFVDECFARYYERDKTTTIEENF